MTVIVQDDPLTAGDWAACGSGNKTYCSVLNSLKFIQFLF